MLSNALMEPKLRDSFQGAVNIEIRKYTESTFGRWKDVVCEAGEQPIVSKTTAIGIRDGLRPLPIPGW